MQMHSKQFEIVRPDNKHAIQEYVKDGKDCPQCGMPTEVGSDPKRRYCTIKVCNALILED